MSNAVSHIWAAANDHPDRTALQDEAGSWTFAELRNLIGDFALDLRAKGIRPHDRVLLVCPTSSAFVVAYFALLSVGAIAVTVNSASTSRELSYFLKDSECALVIAWHECAEAATSAAEESGIARLTLHEIKTRKISADSSFEPMSMSHDDVAVLLYTSGTTGRPKGAELSHTNLIACAWAFRTALQINSRDKVGTALPLFHIFGQVVVMGTAFSAGASMTLFRKFDAAQILRKTAESELSVLAGVPTMWNGMLHAQSTLSTADFKNLRLGMSGGAALPLAVVDALRTRFGATVLGGYGLSETTGTATFDTPGGLPKEGSVGHALPGIELEVRDPAGDVVPLGEVGEIAIRGPVLMNGYWNREDDTHDAIRNGWLMSGDLGRMDADGYLWIVGRKKDLIIRGGYNVYPREIEDLLYEHPDIREAAVIGIPDDRLGEEICAVIAPRTTAMPDFQALSSWLLDRLARYKVPRIYSVVDELPKGQTGKITKRNLDASEMMLRGERVTLRTKSATPAAPER